MGYYIKLKDWLKSNLFPGSMLIVGMAIFLIASVFNTEYAISSSLRLSFYISFFLFFLFFLFFFIENKSVVAVNVVLLSLLILVIEIACFFMLGMPVAYQKVFKLPDLPDDHIGKNIGTVPFADSVYRKVLMENNDTVYDVRYSIDAHSLRITPDHDSAKKDFALFFGCSIAFGLGLEDNETLPYQFQELSGKYNSYNYAYEGYGTNHMLARLEFQDLSQQVTENDGIAIYIFFWDHIYRAIGSMDRYCEWLFNAPYYTYEDEELVRKKMFKDGRYFLSKTYEYIHQTSIVKQFGINFPYQLTSDHFDLVTEMILKSKDNYASQFGNDNFYVALCPSYITYTKDEMDQFKLHLDKKNITSIDLNDFIQYGPQHTLGGDPHPNANTIQIIVKELWKRIAQIKTAAS